MEEPTTEFSTFRLKSMTYDQAITGLEKACIMCEHLHRGKLEKTWNNLYDVKAGPEHDYHGNTDVERMAWQISVLDYGRKEFVIKPCVEVEALLSKPRNVFKKEKEESVVK